MKELLIEEEGLNKQEGGGGSSVVAIPLGYISVGNEASESTNR